MSKKNNFPSALVYSTDPDLKPGYEEPGEQDSLPPAEQKLKVRLETKHRGGKAVTLVEHFIGTLADKETLGRKLKTFCGTGGSVKENGILIQGDNREKILKWLLMNGYKLSKKI